MIESISNQFSTLWGQALGIWDSGGWAMWPLALIAIVMFAMGVHIWIKLRQTGFTSVPESKWRRWITRPEDRRGKIGAGGRRINGLGGRRRAVGDKLRRWCVRSRGWCDASGQGREDQDPQDHGVSETRTASGSGGSCHGRSVVNPCVRFSY